MEGHDNDLFLFFYKQKTKWIVSVNHNRNNTKSANHVSECCVAGSRSMLTNENNGREKNGGIRGGGGFHTLAMFVSLCAREAK